jgi:hypothetical protein
MCSYQDFVEDVVWKDSECNLSRVANGMERYVLPGIQPSNTDIKLYNVAKFLFGTEGNTAVVIGRLFVEYDIDFSIPQIGSVGSDAQSGSLYSTGSTVANYFGTAAYPEGLINPSNLLDVVTFNNLIIGGKYSVMWTMQAAVITTAPTITMTSGGTQITAFTGITSGTNCYDVMTFRATSNTATVTLGGVTVLTTPAICYLNIGLIQDLNSL